MNNYKLGDLIKIKHGYAFKSNNYVSKGKYKLVTLGNFDDSNSFKSNEDKAIYYSSYFPKEFILKNGDLVIPLTEQVVGLLGNSAFIPNSDGFEYVLNQRVGKVILDENKVNKYYLHYLLATQYVKEQIEARASGTKQRNVSPEGIYDVLVYLPDLKTQEKIGNFLYQIENKIDNNKKNINESENIIKMIYDYWFVQFEFPNKNGNPYKSSGGKMIYNERLKKHIPVEWEYKMVEDFCNVFTGKKDVNQSKDYGKYKFYSCSPNYKFSDDLLYSGKAILISGNGSYTGRTIFIDDAFDLYQRTYACVEKNKNNILSYVYYSMLRFFVPVVSGGTHGSAIPYIVYDDIAKYSILYNQDIVKKFVDKINPIQDNIIKLNKENEELTNLKNYLLPLLMNGQVSFKD